MDRITQILEKIRSLRYGDAYKGNTFLALSEDRNTVYYANCTPAGFFGTPWTHIQDRVRSAPIEKVVGW